MSSDNSFLIKLCNYCQQIGLLNQEHFDVLVSCAELGITTKPSVTITINVKKVIPIATFKYLWNNMKKLSNSIKVQFKGELIDDTTSELSQYIQYFLEMNHIKNIGIINLVKRQAFNIMESGTLMVLYFNKIELDEFKIHEAELITFLSSIGFNIKDVDYQIDED
jgi:DNA polymerase III alpha subunit (gram-positive type)